MAQVTEVAVPDIGDFDEVPVIEVLVEPGQAVQAEDPLITLESDKATMEVPAPGAGVVQELKVSVGDKVSEGTVILTLTEEGGEDAPAEGGGGDAAAEPDDEGGPTESAAPGSVDTATQAEAADAPEEVPETDAEAGAQAPPPMPDIESSEERAGVAAQSDGEVAYASPVARRAARALGVDLTTVQGSGRNGRITREDVERAAGGEDAGTPAAAPAAGGAIPGLNLAPWPKVDFAKYGEVEVVELARIKRISGPNLARNWVMIPHVTHHDEADITDLEAFRKQLNAEQDVKVTMVALLLKACVASLRAFPEFNASLDGERLVLKRYYHVGFAADTPGGLVVPVIRDVDRKGLLELAGELRELSGRAREGKLKPAEMAGGTFTISSLGGIGGTAFTPIVNAPELAILGVTRSAMKPVWDGSAFVPRLMVPLSLSYDHRVIDGAAAARFMVHLCGVLTDLRRVLL